MKFIVLILGVIAIIFPKQAFMFGRGWMYKEKKELGETESLPRKMLMFGRGWMIKDGAENKRGCTKNNTRSAIVE